MTGYSVKGELERLVGKFEDVRFPDHFDDFVLVVENSNLLAHDVCDLLDAAYGCEGKFSHCTLHANGGTGEIGLDYVFGDGGATDGFERVIEGMDARAKELDVEDPDELHPFLGLLRRLESVPVKKYLLERDIVGDAFRIALELSGGTVCKYAGEYFRKAGNITDVFYREDDGVVFKWCDGTTTEIKYVHTEHKNGHRYYSNNFPLSYAFFHMGTYNKPVRMVKSHRRLATALRTDSDELLELRKLDALENIGRRLQDVCEAIGDLNNTVQIIGD